MDVGFKTDPGRVRENNEDACLVLNDEKIFIVCDGVGGGNSGEIASNMAIEGIFEYLRKNPLEGVDSLESFRDYFTDCINLVNSQVIESSRRDPEKNGMATTIVLTYFRNGRCYVMNIGDSRAYHIKEGIMEKISVDHTYVNILLQAGMITSDEAQSHRNKNMITRAIGAEDEVRPDFSVHDINAGDRVLLCSDGLYQEVEPDVIADRMLQEKTCSEIAQELTDLANENGGRDNITLICIRIMEDINE